MRAPAKCDAMQPLIVLVIMPVFVGVLAAVAFRSLRFASLAAALASSVILYASLDWLNRGGTWTILATLLVLPLTLAFALAAVVTVFGHGPFTHPRSHR